jgi:putative membrane protein
MEVTVAENYNNFFPALNAALNGTSAILLALGFFFVKNKQLSAHRNSMILAFLVSSVFLVSYLYYHFNYTSQRFEGSSLARTLYLIMLVSHILGAIILVPGVIGMLTHAAKKNWQKHKKLGRWVFPLWMYISVTGVLIYFSLYGVKKL